MANEPVAVKLRTYHVGFGDCFLLSFRYDDEVGERHVLIDFGSTEEPPNKDKILLKAAEDIRERIKNGELTAIVATHRHKDHIDGFRTSSDGTGPGDVIRACHPKLVMQPWTEDPALDTAADAPADPNDGKRFRLALADLHAMSEAIKCEAHLYKPLGLDRELGFLGENNLPNASAVRNLIEMGRASKAEYVCAGFKTSLSEMLPGVEVTVLGPPTLKQSSAIKRQRPKDEEEFWHLWQHTVRAMRRGLGQEKAGVLLEEPVPLFQCGARYSPSENPPQLRWFRRKMREMRGRELLELVRTLDKVLNNTSVILLFEVRCQRLLFPGDAQIENWSYALDDDEIRDKLKRVNFYKVGHHGSLNATPKSLFELFKSVRRENPGVTPLKTVVSTLAGKHGDPKAGTEVPRATLVTELALHSDYYSTQAMEKSTDIFHDIDLL